MKIEAVEAFVVSVPLVGTFSTSHNVRDALTSVVVRIRDSAGQVGYGSIDPAPGYMEETVDDVYRTITGTLADCIIGMNPSDRRIIADRLGEAAPLAFCARAAIEIGVWDLHGKSSNQSLARMLGGTYRDRIPLIGWIGLVDPEKAAQQARDWRRNGFLGIKLKVGSGNADDIARLRAVREAIGPEVHLRVDANEHFSRTEAISFLREAARYRLDLCEQPIPRGQWRELASIRRETNIPIMVDEGIYGCADILAVYNAGAADAIKFKVMKHGGIQPMIEAMQFAEALGFHCTVGHGFTLSTVASVEAVLAGILRQPLLPAEMVGPLKLRADVVDPPLTVQDGAALLPQGPGIGVAVSEERLREYQVLKSVR